MADSKSKTDLELLMESSWATVHLANAILTTQLGICRAASQRAFEGRGLLARLEGNQRTMNGLGDILNGMDAVTDEDDGVGPVFDALRKRLGTTIRPA